MAFGRGPNIVTDGLVFGYDADERSTRFYKGEPTTNLCKYTTDFGISWTKIGVTITNNATLAPDNTNTASTWTCTNATNHQLFQSHNSSGAARVFSIYVKKTLYSGCYLFGYNEGYVVYFNLDTGKVVSTVGTGVNGTINSVGNDWYRISIYLPTITVEFHVGFLDTVYSGTSASPWTISTAVGTSGYIWGPQIEAKTHPTPYIPNPTSGTSTRLSTQSLIDLKKTNTIDLTNVSFDWKGSPYFYAGGNNSITITNTTQLVPTNTTSWEAVIKLTSEDLYKAIFQKSVYSNSTGFIAVHTNSNGRMRLEVSDVAETTRVLSFINSNTYFPINRYAHWVLTYDGSNFKSYLNGELKDTIVWTYGLGTNQGNLIIGGFWGGYWNGDIKIFRQYNKTLSASEVLQNFNASKGRFEEENKLNEGLVLYLDANNKNSFVSGSTTWYDLAGSNNGTLINGVTFNPTADGSLMFDGVNDYVDIPYSATLSPTSQITFGGWYYKSNWNDSVNCRMLSKTEGGGYQLTQNEGTYVPTGNTGVIVRLVGAGNYVATYIASNGISSGFHHMIGTFDGRYLKFYVDGVLKSTYDRGTSDTILYVSNNSLIVGAEAQSGTGAGGQYFNGYIAQTKIWSRSLTDVEVSQLFNNEKTRYGL